MLNTIQSLFLNPHSQARPVAVVESPMLMYTQQTGLHNKSFDTYKEK